jgi:hypothetical protein
MKAGKSFRKADITINTIFFAFLGVITILFLLSFFSLQLPTFAKQVYCKTFFYLRSSTFMPLGIRQEQNYCREFSAMDFSEVIPRQVYIREFYPAKRTEFLAFSSKENKSVSIFFEKNITLTRGSFMLSGNSSDVTVYLCNFSAEIKKGKLAPEREYSTGNIASGIKSCLSKCVSFPCAVGIEIESAEGSLSAFSLSIEQKECVLNDEIASNIAACWEKANFGMSKEKMICKALIIRKCTSSAVNESTVTETLKEKGVCAIIGNSDYNCGESDNILWQGSTFGQENTVMIEYSPESKAIIVS